MDWHLLPPATESMIADVALAAQGRFTGDPSHEYEHTEMRIKGEGDDAMEGRGHGERRGVWVTQHRRGYNEHAAFWK